MIYKTSFAVMNKRKLKILQKKKMRLLTTYDWKIHIARKIYIKTCHDLKKKVKVN